MPLSLSNCVLCWAQYYKYLHSSDLSSECNSSVVRNTKQFCLIFWSVTDCSDDSSPQDSGSNQTMINWTSLDQHDQLTKQQTRGPTKMTDRYCVRLRRWFCACLQQIVIGMIQQAQCVRWLQMGSVLPARPAGPLLRSHSGQNWDSAHSRHECWFLTCSQYFGVTFHSFSLVQSNYLDSFRFLQNHSDFNSKTNF